MAVTTGLKKTPEVAPSGVFALCTHGYYILLATTIIAYAHFKCNITTL